MESALSQKTNSTWIAQRRAGKMIHHEKTNTIKDFVAYAKEQGSHNAEMYYQNIAKLENKALFILDQKFKNLRDLLDLNQLSTISSADAIAARAIDEGMRTGLHYKDIYQLAKKRVELFADLRGKTFIPTTSLISHGVQA